MVVFAKMAPEQGRKMLNSQETRATWPENCALLIPKFLKIPLAATNSHKGYQI